MGGAPLSPSFSNSLSVVGGQADATLRADALRHSQEEDTMCRHPDKKLPALLARSAPAA